MTSSWSHGFAILRAIRTPQALDIGRLGLGSVATLWLLCDLLGAAETISPRDAWLINSVPVGLMVGFSIASLQKHPTRWQGLIPLGALGLTAGLAIWLTRGIGWTCSLIICVSASLFMTPRRRAGKDVTAPHFEVRAWHGGRVAATTLSLILMSGAFYLRWAGIWSGAGPLRVLTAISVATMLVSGWCYRRQCFEQLLEVLIWPMYRIRAFGPGLHQCPACGPVLIISNHTAYADPIWIMKVVPRELTPMMLSRYYDLPVLHWVTVTFIRAIRVTWSQYRREAPELLEAVARLDAGEGVLVFPEGWVRRTEEVPVRRFGQGLWRILRERPMTPVIACWIEGGWGSFSSFQGGPPFWGRWPDWRRPIDIAVCAPIVLDTPTIDDQRLMRERLREMVIQAREHLGLAPFVSDPDRDTVELDG
jgi:1-acyl-sn-glycerol-3-phosphate acyltransferase